MKKLSDLLATHPNYLSKYVDMGMKLAELFLLPSTKLLEHLLLVQNISLDTVPGKRFRDDLIDRFGGPFTRKKFEGQLHFNTPRNKFMSGNSKEPIQVSVPIDLTAASDSYESSEINLANKLDKLIENATGLVSDENLNAWKTLIEEAGTESDSKVIEYAVDEAPLNLDFPADRVKARTLLALGVDSKDLPIIKDDNKKSVTKKKASKKAPVKKMPVKKTPAKKAPVKRKGSKR